MKTLVCAIITACVLSVGGIVHAEHSSSCKNVHGKISVVTDDSVTVNDKLYKVGDTTRIKKNGEKVKVSALKPGDIVCLDKRGKDDVGGEIAAVTVLTPEEGATITKIEKETTKEKTKETEKRSQ